MSMSIPEPGLDPKLQRLLEVVLERTGGGSFSDILSDTRGPKEAAAQRRIAMYLHYEYSSKNFSETGRTFNRDRTTVRHAYEQIVGAMTDKNFKTKIANMRAALVTRDTIST